MEDFKGVSEKFHVSLLSDEGHESERVVCQIGLDGLFVLSQDAKRTLRKYPLNHISRWALRGSSLVLYTKTPVDVEERTVTLQSDDQTIRSALDTLTSCCMQLVELLQSGEKSGEATQATNSLTALLNGGPPRKASLPSAEDVEFWSAPEKAGWLQSQGDHIKTWRRRWFVLKQGFLFRFATADVNSSSKPRGLVDMSKVTDVSEARDATGRNNSLMLSTPTGRVCYVADSETEQVEWLSALEGSLANIMKQIAGVEDEPTPVPAPAQQSAQSQWAKQLEKSYGAASSGGGGGGGSVGGSRASDRNTMVKIVGYNADSAPGERGQAPSYNSSDYSAGSSFGYDNIAGIAGIRTTAQAAPDRRPTSGSTFTDSFVKVDYPAYPVLAPTPLQAPQQQPVPGSYSGSSAGGYGQYEQPHVGAYSGGYAQASQQPQPHQQASFSGGYAQSGQPQAQYGGYTAPQQQQQSQHDAQSGSTYGSAVAFSYQQPQQQQQQQHGGGYQAGQGAGSQQQMPSYAAHTTWQQLLTSEGQPYYHNTSTGATQWEQPGGFV